MKIYRHFVNFTKKGSLNYKLRQNRLKMFLSQISNMKKPLRILDIGGSNFYWEHLFFSIENIKKGDYQITITNINEEQMKKQIGENLYYKFVKADARCMPEFSDGEFDIVHSNSVIEHVGGFNDQLKMALEIRRIGKRFFMQTPNYYFPIEPHFQSLFFHWLPKRMRMVLVRLFAIGHFPRAKNRTQAEEIVDSAQLLSLPELEILFPESVIHKEKIFGLTKSFIVTGKS